MNNPLCDIKFLMLHEPVTEAELRAAFERLRIPDIQELHDAFRAAQPKVLALVKNCEQGNPPNA